MESIASRLGRFAADLSLETPPAEIVEKAKVCVFNGFGMGLNGLSTPYAAVGRHAAISLDGEQASGATLLGDGRRTAVSSACVANAVFRRAKLHCRLTAGEGPRK